ncbi:MAG TPA: cobyrinate a,c-diamide synthase [Acidimicrobiales bacterium]|nr:cobyrinate a,c-diamide synthase [Acidimicrobiales bacterium]
MAGSATLGPRLVIAGTHSGVGKTTVATGLLGALRRAGHRPAGAKVGPDFIDPGYHALACGRPPRNLDPWMCGPDAVAALAGRAAAGADVLIVEGVMGLFDGANDGSPSSTADVARLLDAPVVLVVDASALSSSVAALVSGYAGFAPDVRVAGVVLNRVGSDGHETLLREALAPLGLPVLGALRRDDALTWRDRHLGLVPVAEQPAAVGAALDRLAAAVADRIDVDAVVALARQAPPLAVDPVRLPDRVTPDDSPPLPVAVAAGAAFTFTYQDTLDALVAAGAEPVPFDPSADEALPDGVAGLVAGGGFPEVHAADLAANEPLLADVRRRSAAGLPIWAECGGLLWLGRTLDGTAMAGVVPADARMTERLTLGYRTAVARQASPVAAVGASLRGHEFHYTTVAPGGEALELSARWGARADGFATPTLLATYLHVHPGGDPGPVERFVRTCAGHRSSERVAATTPAPPPR